MDKSEGTNFFSKALSSVTKRTSKLYHLCERKFTLSSLKRGRNEKFAELGSKLYKAMKDDDKKLDIDNLKEDFEALKIIDESIEKINDEVEKINDIDFSKKADIKPRTAKLVDSDGVDAVKGGSAKKRKPVKQAKSEKAKGSKDKDTEAKAQTDKKVTAKKAVKKVTAKDSKAKKSTAKPAATSKAKQSSVKSAASSVTLEQAEPNKDVADVNAALTAALAKIENNKEE